MYEPNYSTTLQVGIVGSTISKNSVTNIFCNMMNEYIIPDLSIYKKFTLSTNIFDTKSYVSLQQYNFIFFVISKEEMIDCETILLSLRKEKLCDVRNHIFIIIDGCDNMIADDDNDLIFEDDAQSESAYKAFVDKISEITNYDNLIDIFRLSSLFANIFLKYIGDKSVVNLSDTEINILAQKMIRKSSKLSKLSLGDKKRELKNILRKENMDDRLLTTGYSDMFDRIKKYFTPVHQKKVICKNYLHLLENCVIEISPNKPAEESLVSVQTNHLVNILNEIYEINYLKQKMQEDLSKKIQELLTDKLEQFYKKTRPHVAIDSGLLSSIDAYQYHTFLSAYIDIEYIQEELPQVKKLIETEIDAVNKLIILHYNKEMEKIIDLDKISAAFRVFANQNKNNVIGLFEKIKSNPKIISENMENMEKWVSFINCCLVLDIPKKMIIELCEGIILEKIKYSVDMTSKINKLDTQMGVIYPHCLSTFVLKNLSKGFIFDKLYMFLSCNIRYSGRNIPELVKNLTLEKYNSILVLEYKLLELIQSTD